MESRSNSRLIAALESLSRAAGAGVSLIGGLVLAGWILDIAALKDILPGSGMIKANSSLSFILAGVSLQLLKRDRAGRRHDGPEARWASQVTEADGFVPKIRLRQDLPAEIRRIFPDTP